MANYKNYDTHITKNKKKRPFIKSIILLISSMISVVYFPIILYMLGKYYKFNIDYYMLELKPLPYYVAQAIPQIAFFLFFLLLVCFIRAVKKTGPIFFNNVIFVLFIAFTIIASAIVYVNLEITYNPQILISIISIMIMSCIICVTIHFFWELIILAYNEFKDYTADTFKKNAKKNSRTIYGKVGISLLVMSIFYPFLMGWSPNNIGNCKLGFSEGYAIIGTYGNSFIVQRYSDINIDKKSVTIHTDTYELIEMDNLKVEKSEYYDIITTDAPFHVR